MAKGRLGREYSFSVDSFAPSTKLTHAVEILGWVEWRISKMWDFRRNRKSRTMIEELDSVKVALGKVEWMRLEYPRHDFWVQDSIGQLLTWKDYYATGRAEIWTAEKGD